MSTNIERLKKLKELALRGVGGEKEQANAILEKLMKKYNISVDELDESIKKIFEFKYNGKREYSILRQISYKVTNEKNNTYIFTRGSSGRKIKNLLGIECTEAQKVEIEFLFHFYKRLFEKEVDALLRAFIQKHALFGELKEGEKGMELSKKELLKMNSLMNGLSNETPQIQITDGNL